MNRSNYIEPFDAKFENIEIHIHKIEVEQINELNKDVLEKQTAYTGIWEDISVS